VFAGTTTTCRAAAGSCDVAETCTGTGASCPDDALVPASTECRPAAGPCDLAEACSGLDAVCPSDAKSTAECRGSTGPCDPAEVCDGIANACPVDALEPNGTICDDGNPCTGTGTCDGSTAPCLTGTPIICPACQACDGVGGCVIGPLGVCRHITGKKAKFIVKNRTPSTRNVMVWKFNKLIDQTEAADFGTPTDPGDAGYDFCVFRDLDPSPDVMDPELVAHLAIPAGPPWRAASTGYKYKKLTSDPKGLLNMSLKAADGLGKLNVKAKAGEVPAISLPLTGPVVVHFQSQSTCWQARYSNAKLNLPDTYKGLADN
jgi:hypothetical protein